ncbi:MAG TPA: triose-phosphate isomerase [Gemmatimonadaceae bacterium]|nr:triose-phosphate isomerase [Gemmatimonadaceae bacterium]
MKHLIFAGNWKMNHAPADAAAFVRDFLAHYQRMKDRTIILFPPALTLPAVVHGLKERNDIQIGVQNIHWEDKGAFTGENSAAIARGAGAKYALVGHSERRHLFGETDAETRKKVGAAFRAGLIPVLCVGETLIQRERGETNDVVLRQLRAGIEGLDGQHVSQMVVAYEPVWAIGTGKNATPTDANDVHTVLRDTLRQATERVGGVPILYGGSVSLANVQALVSQPEVDGVLVGGASLDAGGWHSMVTTKQG